MQTLIFWPMVAQVVLTATVAVVMYRARIGEIRGRAIDPQCFRTTRTGDGVLENVAAADNFRNLFEVPVLFFAVCLALAVTELASTAQLVLAWAFVALRAAHSVIHITYNRVMHRFLAYLASATCVLAMWVLFAVALWRAA